MFKRPRRGVKRVFIHCSASNRPEDSNVETIRLWHLSRGFADIGYHFFIGFDGKIETGRELERLPAAQRGHNALSIAICLAGGQDGTTEAFTTAQFQSLKRLCRAIHDAYDGQITFHGHCEVSNKNCPVFDYETILALTPSGYLKQPRRDLSRSRTIVGGRVATLGAALSAVDESVFEPLAQTAGPNAAGETSTIPTPIVDGLGLLSELEPALLFSTTTGILRIVPWFAVILVLVGVGMAFFARFDDHMRGLR